MDVNDRGHPVTFLYGSYDDESPDSRFTLMCHFIPSVGDTVVPASGSHMIVAEVLFAMSTRKFDNKMFHIALPFVRLVEKRPIIVPQQS